MQVIELRVDMTTAADLGCPVEMAATVHLPDPSSLPDVRIAIFACPGGGYSRQYYDLSFEGGQGYSEAKWHAERGTIHIAIDHVGVGESTIPDLSRISFQMLAATHDACVREIAARLRTGTLGQGFPPVEPFLIGMGQSMGGGVTILAQGRFATFDAIAPFGVSAIHTALPQQDKAAFDHGIRRFDAVAEGRVTNHVDHDHEGVDYRYAFHWDDVPADIVEADMAGGFPVRRTAPAFGSLTIPHCAVGMMLPGAFSADAARVAVPVLVANGERDTCPAPHAEAAAYAASRDVTVFVVPRMAHMHNFASTRELLWQRLGAWSAMLAAENSGLSRVG
jgi:alpha-beta hydrolase superfamily lysophospholipase